MVSPEFMLYYYRARYYNPQIGRFLQTDPIGYGSGMNMYGYCGNGPIGRTDPSGCHEFDPVTSPYPNFTTWEFTCPSLAISQSVTSDNDALAAALSFFNSDKWTGWDGRWSVESAHLEDNGTDVHVRFISYYNEGEQTAPAPDVWVDHIDVQPELFGLISGWEEPVIRLGKVGVGLLEKWKFDRIMAPSRARVEFWPRTLVPHAPPAVWEWALLVGHCDSPFKHTGIDLWEFGKVVYDKSQINYYLEGYAMHHINLWYKEAEAIVLAWKNAPKIVTGEPFLGRNDLGAEFHWFDMGWDEHTGLW